MTLRSETILEPQRWTLEQILDLAELLTAFVAHPDLAGLRVGYLHRGRLTVERDADGNPVRIELTDAQRTVPPDAVAAPEVHAGRPPTLATDLYLVAAVLYEVLTGRPLPPYLPEVAVELPVLPIPGLAHILRAVLDRRMRERRLDDPGAVFEAIEVARAESRPRVASIEAAQMSILGGSWYKLRSQDASAAFTAQLTGRSWPEATALLVLCDGIGSSERGGEVAEAIVRRAGEAFRQRVAEHPVDALRAHLDVHARQLAADVLLPVAERFQGASFADGATWIGALIVGDRLALTSLGDSRAYLVPADEAEGLVPLTVDQSFAGTSWRASRMTWPETTTNPFGNFIEAFAGNHLDADILDAALQSLDAALPGERWVTLRPGDRVLLCSDGPPGALSETEIARLVRGASSCHEAVRDLLEATRSSPRQDNMAAVIARPWWTPGTRLAPIGPPGRLIEPR